MRSRAHPRTDRAVSTVVGTVLLIALVVGSATVVGAFVTGIGPASTAPQATLDATAEADENRITLVHRGGDQLDVERMRLRITVDGDALTTQPPVPFFSAGGFRPGPTGPFNPSTDGRWTAGERASFQIASTNSPTLSTGDQVTITVVVGDDVIAETTVTA
jgi:FlaG/FlaF family flagellin (archaellin)